jgi:hypothetical protein
MNRRVRVISLAMAMAMVGCRETPVNAERAVATNPDAFVGAWRSVTPSLEFARLSVHSTSSRPGVLAARLTLSGVALDVAGRPDADSLVAPMTTAGGGDSAGTIAVRARKDHMLAVELRPTGGVVRELTFVRDE